MPCILTAKSKMNEIAGKLATALNKQESITQEVQELTIELNNIEEVYAKQSHFNKGKVTFFKRNC